MKYSQSTKGFYLDTDTAPTDAVTISHELYVSLISGESPSSEISVGDDGIPCLSARTYNPTLSEELAKLAKQYREDLAALRQNWLSAAVTEGTTETTKKASVTQEMTDTKTQYLADVAAAKARHS